MIKQYKTNNSITAKEVRVIGEDGKQIGILSKEEAVDYALGQGVDLVLIGEMANPPVAKAIDFKKFLYQEQKKEKEAKKSQRNTDIKEVQVGGPFTAEGDINTKINRTEEFIKGNHNVRVVIKFTGRQMSKIDFGHKIIAQFKEKLGDLARIEKDAKMEGRKLITVFAPNK